MNRILLFLSATLFSGVISSSQPDPDILVTNLSDKTILLRLNGLDPHNMIAVNTSDGIVVIDSEISPVIAGAMREKIVEEFGNAKFRYLINTHAHGDHAFGNQVFPEATLIGHTNSTEVMKGFPAEAERSAKRIPALIDNLKSRIGKEEPGSANAVRYQQYITYYQYYFDGVMDGFAPPLPEITFSDQLKLHLGDVTLELAWFGNAHSTTDLLIYSPEEKFLATGDLFIPKMNPPYLNSDNVGHLAHYIATLDKYFITDTLVAHVVPGHVNQLDPVSMKKILYYLKGEQERTSGKENIYPVFEEIKSKSGDPAALDRLSELAGHPDRYFILEGDLVNLGYDYLYNVPDTVKAIRVFTILSETFPQSWNAWDCLGEAYMAADDTEQAIRCYEQSLALNPDNDNARRRVELMRRQD